MRFIKNKKGQSLVEVTVALSILAVVFTGVVTLAINTVGLMVSSRMRTEATALAQEGLENLKGGPGNSCTSSITNTDFTDMPTSAPYDREKKVEDPTNGMPASDYAVVTVRVSWDVRGQPNSQMAVKQIMKRK